MTRSILPLPFLACAFSFLLAADSTAGRYSGGSRSRSYSSGSRSSSSSSSASSGRSSGSYSSGSSNSSAGTRSGGFSSSQSSSSGGTAYGSGRSTYSTGGTASPNAVRASNTAGYDSSAARARAVQDSSQRFTDSRRVVTPPPIPGTPAAAASSRSNWRPRERAPMLNAYRSRPALGFRDGYDLLFWYWLLDQSRPVQAQWMYHHQNTADPARLAELEKKDAALAAEVAALKAQGTPVDPGYTPPGLPAEEMYAEPAGPEEAPAVPFSSAAASPPQQGSSGLSWLVLIAGAGFMAWLIFFKRWNVSTT